MSWKRRVNIKPFITEDDSPEGAKRTAANISNELRQGLNYTEFDTWELHTILDGFGDCGSADDLDTCLEDLYDWADQNRIWLGLK